jgi:hypothetical protein
MNYKHILTRINDDYVGEITLKPTGTDECLEYGNGGRTG